jgi:3'(2'), 5'-bisphosphate nucleotidase
MTGSPPTLWLQAHDAATRAALAAWRAIEPLYHGRYDIEDKPDGPSTDADRLADRVIVEALEAAFPRAGHGFLTEESEDGRARLDRERVWIVDPVDGTKDFIRHNGNFAMHIALVERTGDLWLPVAAVVYRPVAGHLYSAVRGRGAWRRDVAPGPDGALAPGKPLPIRVSARGRIEIMRSVVSNSHRTSRLMRLIESLPLESYIHIGSLGIKLALIAEGQAELYINLGLGKTKEWDTCAPHLVLTEAGGTLTDLAGAPLAYNRPEVRHQHGLLASHGPLHEAMVGRVREFLETAQAEDLRRKAVD